MKLTTKKLKELRKISKEYRKSNEIKCPICKKIAGNWCDELSDEDSCNTKWVYCKKCKIRIYEY